MAVDRTLLLINSGSFSIQSAGFAEENYLKWLWSGTLERVGIADSRFHGIDAEGITGVDAMTAIWDHAQAPRKLFELRGRLSLTLSLSANCHHLVHGYAHWDFPLIVISALAVRLQRLAVLALVSGMHHRAPENRIADTTAPAQSLNCAAKPEHVCCPVPG